MRAFHIALISTMKVPSISNRKTKCPFSLWTGCRSCICIFKHYYRTFLYQSSSKWNSYITTLAGSTFSLKWMFLFINFFSLFWVSKGTRKGNWILLTNFPQFSKTQIKPQGFHYHSSMILLLNYHSHLVL